MSNKKTFRVKASDFDRVLLTETLPFETPIIFSNDGIYETIKSRNTINTTHQLIIKEILETKKPYTIPYFYNIKKGEADFRRLAIPHPSAQKRIRDFYENHHSLILYYCSLSPISIRAPHKIASRFYLKNKNENLNQYKKTSSITTAETDVYRKHVTGFFSYKGHHRLYKFFESNDYINLEKKYTVMLSLDVTKCFDSIYTHTISWATKSKDFTKETKSAKGSFGSEFDKLMMFCNHEETNGIIIGPEFSRIFAEIIFQKIDTSVIMELSNLNKKYDINYTIRRYVDDVYIFAESRQTAEFVYNTYTSKLLDYNLHTNSAKKSILDRPFVTKKSRVITTTKDIFENFLIKFLINSNLPEVRPKKIRNIHKLAYNFIESIKSLCSYNELHYNEVSSFLTSAFTQRIKNIVSIDHLENTDENTQETQQKIEQTYTDALLTIFEILFFFYETAPSVQASYHLSTALILSIRFSSKYTPLENERFSHRIYELIHHTITNPLLTTKNDGSKTLPLELLNLLLTARELGDKYLLPQELISRLFDSQENKSYFSIVCFLYYIQANSKYIITKTKVLDAAKNILGECSKISQNSEHAYLLMDLLSCPYVEKSFRIKLLKDSCRALQIPTPTGNLINECLDSNTTHPAHVSWKNIDLLNILEKNNLKPAY